MTGRALHLAELATLPSTADVFTGEGPADMLHYLGLPQLLDARALVEHGRNFGSLDHAQMAVLEVVEAVHAAFTGDRAGLQARLHRLQFTARSWSIAARPGGVR